MIFKSTQEKKKLPAMVHKLFSERMGNVLALSGECTLVQKEAGKDKDGEDKKIEIMGVANAASPDRVDELINPKGWQLENYLANPVILRNHDHGLIVGRATEVDPKDDGLYYSAIIGEPEKARELTPMQRETRSLLAQDILKTSSVGFLPFVMEYDEENDVLTYMKNELLEISLVAVPMQPQSILTSVKNMAEFGSYRHLPIIRGVNEMKKPKTKTEETTPNAEEKAEGEEAMAEIMARFDSIDEKLGKIYDMIESMGEEGTDDGEGDEGNDGAATEESLREEIAKLKEEKEAAEKAVNETNDKVEKLMTSLREKGLIK